MSAGALEYALSFGASALGVAVARRRREYVPVAALLVFDLEMDMLRRALSAVVIRPAVDAATSGGVVAPLHGFARAAMHLDQALFMAWPVGIAIVTAIVCRRSKVVPWVVAAIWMLASTYLVVQYPEVRGRGAQSVFVPIEVGAIMSAIGSIAEWRMQAPRPSPQIEHGAVLSLALIESLVATVFYGNLPDLWPLARAAYLVLHLAFVLIQGGVIWWMSASSSGSQGPRSLS